MPDRNTSSRSHDRGGSPSHNPAGSWSGTSLHDHYRAIGISAVAAAARWPDHVTETKANRDSHPDELPLRLRNLD